MISSYLQTYLHVFMSATKYSIVVRGKESFETFTENLQKTKNILSVLCTFIQITETSALICLGDQSESSGVTVLSQDSSMYIFNSHITDDSGMPSANGTAVLMHFNNIESTVSFICQLAHSLAAKMFHWTFWHSVPATSCDCEMPMIPSFDVLSEQEIMSMYSELVPTVPEQTNRRTYYRSYK